jgi:hypothetical protein
MNRLSIVIEIEMMIKMQLLLPLLLLLLSLLTREQIFDCSISWHFVERVESPALFL